jgi:hypothetical protein
VSRFLASEIFPETGESDNGGHAHGLEALQRGVSAKRRFLRFLESVDEPTPGSSEAVERATDADSGWSSVRAQRLRIGHSDLFSKGDDL